MPRHHLYSKYVDSGDLGHFDKDKWLKAYEIALETRKFEIDLYWKRTAYFWVLIGAAFTFYAAASFRGVDGDVRVYGQLIASALGVVLSLAWVLANKGSKFWQENWEAHVDLLEDAFTGPLYKTILHKKHTHVSLRKLLLQSCPYSVSKINLIVSYFILLIWLFIFARQIFPQIDDWISYFENIPTDSPYPYSLDGVKLCVAVLTLITIFGLLTYATSSFAKDPKVQTPTIYDVTFRDIQPDEGLDSQTPHS